MKAKNSVLIFLALLSPSIFAAEVAYYLSSDKVIFNRRMPTTCEQSMAREDNKAASPPLRAPQLFGVYDNFVSQKTNNSLRAMFVEFSENYKPFVTFSIDQGNGNNMTVSWLDSPAIRFTYMSDGRIANIRWPREALWKSTEPLYQRTILHSRYRGAMEDLIQKAVTKLVKSDPAQHYILLKRHGQNEFQFFMLQYFLKFMDIPDSPLKKHLYKQFGDRLLELGPEPMGGGQWHADVDQLDMDHIVQGIQVVSFPETIRDGNTYFSNKSDRSVVSVVNLTENAGLLFDGRKTWHRVQDFYTREMDEQEVSRDVIGYVMRKYNPKREDSFEYSEPEWDTRALWPSGLKKKK